MLVVSQLLATLFASLSSDCKWSGLIISGGVLLIEIWDSFEQILMLESSCSKYCKLCRLLFSLISTFEVELYYLVIFLVKLHDAQLHFRVFLDIDQGIRLLVNAALAIMSSLIAPYHSIMSFGQQPWSALHSRSLSHHFHICTFCPFCCLFSIQV